METTNPRINFDAENHQYTTDTGRKLISVTQFIDQFFEKFDAPAVAARCAPKRNTTPEALMAEWKAEGDRGRREGTHAHAYAEALLTGATWWEPPANIREAHLYQQTTRAVVSLLKNFDFVGAEVIVASERLGVAGTIDLLMRDRSNYEMIIFDWKQNKRIDRDNQWRKALPPIDHLDDCDFVKYNLQLALYHRILIDSGHCEKQPFRAGLIHLREDDYKVYPLKSDMGVELDRMMEVI